MTTDKKYVTLGAALLAVILACPPAQAAPKSRSAAKAADYKEIPAFNWDLAASGFMELFKLHNQEIESTEPNRFFPGSVAFSMGRLDADGHFLMLKCSAAANCGAQRAALEERLVSATLLEVVRTRAPKDQLFNANTWQLTGLGEKYIQNLRRRYPDLSARLGRLIGAYFRR